MENEFDLHHVLVQHSVLLFFILAGTLSIASLIVGAKLIVFFEKKKDKNRDGEVLRRGDEACTKETN